MLPLGVSLVGAVLLATTLTSQTRLAFERFYRAGARLGESWTEIRAAGTRGGRR